MSTFTEMKESDKDVPEPEIKGKRFRMISSIGSSVASKIFLLTLSWWGASVFIVLLIKSIITTDFPHAFAVSGFTNIGTGVLAWLFTRGVCPCAHHPTQKLTWKESFKLAVLGFIQGVEIACGNKSLEYLSVSARTMAGSTNVLFMMLTARLWGLERLGCVRLVSATLLCIGGALQGLDKLGGKPAETLAYSQGMLLQLTTMLIASQRWALVQFVIQRSPQGSALAQMSKLKLVQRTVLITGSVCFLLSCCFEQGALASGAWCRVDLVAKMLGIALAIVVVTVSELEIVRKASAVAIQILGTLHTIPITFAGILFYSEVVHGLSWFGFSLCIAGGLCYVAVRYRETHSSSPEEVPVELAEHRLLDAGG